VAHTQADLDTAARHVMEGAERIADLKRNIDRARALGHPTELAEKALVTMRQTYELMLEHHAAIEDALLQGR
jgi:hypothetical protein